MLILQYIYITSLIAYNRVDSIGERRAAHIICTYSSFIAQASLYRVNKAAIYALALSLPLYSRCAMTIIIQAIRAIIDIARNAIVFAAIMSQELYVYHSGIAIYIHEDWVIR